MMRLFEAITAHHGTPHDLERFSLRYVGTGEGVQAFGYGIYLAQNSDIADGYASKLSTYDRDWDEQPAAIRFDGRTLALKRPENEFTPEERAAMAFWFAGRDQGKAIEETEGMMRMLPHDHPNHIMDSETLAVLKSQNMHGRVTAATPMTYRVEINREDGDFLLWDRSISQQPHKIRESISAILGDSEATTGKAAYQAICATLADRRGWGPDKAASAQKLASMTLYKRGVAGIKYLDGSSRGSGEGNYNYVVFNPSDIQILSKQ